MLNEKKWENINVKVLHVFQLKRIIYLDRYAVGTTQNLPGGLIMHNLQKNHIMIIFLDVRTEKINIRRPTISSPEKSETIWARSRISMNFLKEKILIMIRIIGIVVKKNMKDREKY